MGLGDFKDGEIRLVKHMTIKRQNEDIWLGRIEEIEGRESVIYHKDGSN